MEMVFVVEQGIAMKLGIQLVLLFAVTFRTDSDFYEKILSSEIAISFLRLMFYDVMSERFRDFFVFPCY